MKSKFKLLTIILVVVVVIFTGAAYYKVRKNIPIIFSPKTMVFYLWEKYKTTNIDPTSARTVDEGMNLNTTSEGQSYSMLRAVWMDDKKTFDDSWRWTQTNLQHQDDSLFSWLYGDKGDGTYGVLVSRGGENSASDADTDIALALLFAYSRWQDESYLNSAKLIIGDIWEKDVVVIAGKPYLAADNVEKKSSGPVIVNPSYFNPAAYRIFNSVDSHPWGQLVSTSFDVIEKSVHAPLDTVYGVLPPDWLTLDRGSGEIMAAKSPQGASDYGFDAMRIPWRLALDWEWNRDPRTLEALNYFAFLSQQWKDNHAIYASYDHAGKIVYSYETPAVYGGAMGYFMATDPSAAKDIYETKLVSLYNPDKNDWKSHLGYYDDNWAWFGISLYNHLLPNLWL